MFSKLDIINVKHHLFTFRLWNNIVPLSLDIPRHYWPILNRFKETSSHIDVKSETVLYSGTYLLFDQNNNAGRSAHFNCGSQNTVGSKKESC